MGLFSTNKVNKAQISPLPEPSVQAAVGNSYSRNAAAPNMIGSWYTYQAGQARNRAISVPAISRSRDLMASVLASMELEMCTEIWNGNEMETVPLAPRTWLKQLDPEMPNSFLFPWVFDDFSSLEVAFFISPAAQKTVTWPAPPVYPRVLLTRPTLNRPCGSVSQRDLFQRWRY
jgi:hypothetical protein